jgi:hypothetical protein
MSKNKFKEYCDANNIKIGDAEFVAVKRAYNHQQQEIDKLRAVINDYFTAKSELLKHI